LGFVGGTNRLAVATGSKLGALYLWDASAGQRVVFSQRASKFANVASVRAPSISDISISPDGKTMAICVDPGVLLWDVAHERETALLPRKANLFTKSVFLCSGTRLATLGGVISVWRLDASSGAPVVEKDYAEIKGGLLCPLPDQRHCVTVLASGIKQPSRLVLWDLQADRQLHEIQCHEGAVTGIAVSQSNLVATCGVDGQAIIWEIGKRD
jgi:WD40 repeat protein